MSLRPVSGGVCSCYVPPLWWHAQFQSCLSLPTQSGGKLADNNGGMTLESASSSFEIFFSKAGTFHTKLNKHAKKTRTNEPKATTTTTTTTTKTRIKQTHDSKDKWKKKQKTNKQTNQKRRETPKTQSDGEYDACESKTLTQSQRRFRAAETLRECQTRNRSLGQEKGSQRDLQ